MARYRVNTKFVFSGMFEVEADSRTEARELVMKECGLVMSESIHTTLEDEEVGWDFEFHPETEIGRITIKRNCYGNENVSTWTAGKKYEKYQLKIGRKVRTMYQYYYRDGASGELFSCVYLTLDGYGRCVTTGLN